MAALLLWAVILRFNPTMVRLGPLHEASRAAAGARFNPTMVRLGLFDPATRKGLRALFQSHYGAIRTEVSLQGLAAVALRFNPTMVRLGPTRFPGRSAAEHRFNPTMVRLGRPGGPARGPESSAFQSHYGAIRTAAPSGADRQAIRFQSHYGAIRTPPCQGFPQRLFPGIRTGDGGNTCPLRIPRACLPVCFLKNWPGILVGREPTRGLARPRGKTPALGAFLFMVRCGAPGVRP